MIPKPGLLAWIFVAALCAAGSIATFRTRETSGTSSVVLEWPHDQVSVTLREASTPGEAPDRFRSRVVESFKALADAFPPRSSQ